MAGARQRIFVGSSTETLDVARAIQSNLEGEFRVRLWNDDVFQLTYSGLDGLLQVLGESDAGVFVLGADDLTTMRGRTSASVRGNVLVELGMFLGRHGRDRTFMLTPRDAPEPPSDLEGITRAAYDVRPGGEAVVGSACNQVRKALRKRTAPEESPSRTRLDRAMKRLSHDLEQLLSAASPARAGEDDGNFAEPVTFGLGPATVTMIAERIEHFVPQDRRDVVLLPANEYFDDRCFEDAGSSLGAYVEHHFGDRLPEFLGEVHAALEELPCEPVTRTSTKVADSYGVGQAIHLGKLEPRVIVASATTERAGVGLRAEPHFLYATLQGVVELMNEERLKRLTMPVLGAGHGGMPTRVALLFNLLALKSILSDPVGRHIDHVQIVVFERSAADVAPNAIRDILEQVGAQPVPSG